MFFIYLSLYKGDVDRPCLVAIVVRLYAILNGSPKK